MDKNDKNKSPKINEKNNSIKNIKIIIHEYKRKIFKNKVKKLLLNLIKK